jgi:hypothetical protein
MAHPQNRNDTPELRLRCLTEFPPPMGLTHEVSWGAELLTRCGEWTRYRPAGLGRRLVRLRAALPSCYECIEGTYERPMIAPSLD